jgi:DNA-binding transcriptional ArsR family regulator
MKDPIQPQRCAELLHALAAPERLRIIRLLRGGPHNVSDIAAALKTAVVNASHHLSVLRHAGLVRGRKQGRFVHYSLTPGVFEGGEQEGEAEHINLGCCRLELPPPPPESGPRPPA